MTFASLKTKVANYLDRSDLTSIIPDFINMAMHKLERKNNFRHMAVRTTTSLASGDYFITNPFPRYKELYNAHIVDSDGNRYPPLLRRSFDVAVNAYPNFTTNKGRPVAIAEYQTVEASLTTDAQPTFKFLLRPTCDASYTLDLGAYQYSPDLDDVTYTTNWWTENAWEILLYASLLEAEPYLQNDARIVTWKSLLDESLSDLIRAEAESSISGSYQSIGSNVRTDF